MVFKIYYGESILNTRENEQLDIIRNKLQAMFGRSEEPCHFVVGSEFYDCEIDGLVIKRNGIVILELKNLEGRIEANWIEKEVNGKVEGGLQCTTISPDGEDYIYPKDPFQQIKRQRHEVAKLLAEVLKVPGYQFRSKILPFISGLVVVREGSQIQMKDLPFLEKRWFSVATPSGALEWIKLQSRRMSWKREDIESFIERIGAEEVDAENWMVRQSPTELRIDRDSIGTDHLLLSTFSNLIEALNRIAIIRDLKVTISGYMRRTLHYPQFDGARLAYLDRELAGECSFGLVTAIGVVIELGLSQYMPEILSSLHHEDENVRNMVVEAIAEFEPDGTTDLLIGYLNDGSQTVRRKAMQSLSLKGDSSATPHLLKVVESENEDDVLLAISVLGQIGDESAIDSLITLHKEYVSRFGDRRFRGPPVGTIIKALGTIGSPKAVDFISDFLQGEDWHGISAAIEALGLIRSSESKNALLTVLARKDDFCSEVIFALGELGDEDIAPHMHAFLINDDDSVCGHAIRALREIGSRESFEPLWEVFHNKIEQGVEVSGYMSPVELSFDALSRIDRQTLEERMIPMLAHENADIRRRIVLLHSGIASDRSLEAYFSLMSDPDETIWSSASHIVAKIGGKSLLPRITTLLDSRIETERASAVYAIWEVDKDEGLETILPLRTDESETVRMAVTFVLGQIADVECVKYLTELAGDVSSRIREEALFELNLIGQNTILPRLETAIQEGSDVENAQMIHGEAQRLLDALKSLDVVESNDEVSIRSRVQDKWKRILNLTEGIS